MKHIIDDLQYLKETKELIRNSIVNKGVEVPIDTPFRQYASKIGEIETGSGGSKTFVSQNDRDRISIDNIYTSSGNIGLYQRLGTIALVNDNDFWSLTVKVKVNSMYYSEPNLIFGLDNSVAIGYRQDSQYFGVWQNGLTGDSDTGRTSLPVVTGKWHIFKLTETKTPSGCNILLDVKYNEEDEFVNIFNKTAFQTHSTSSGINLGSCRYIDQNWYSNTAIDLNSIKFETNISN